MQAVILVGGEGRRLRPLTDTRPKPMMRLVDRPFVEHQLDHLRRFGVDHVVFSCGYLPEALLDHFGDGSRVGIRLSYVVDPEPLGTGGAIRNAETELDPSARLLVLNGDVLTDLDLAALVAQHEADGVDGTLALTPVEDPSRYGLVRLFADRRVEEFLEKPSDDELRPGEPFLINAGTYLFEPPVLAAIPAGRPSSIERDIFPVLAESGRLAGFPSDAYWRDIGTPDSYLDAHLDVLSGVVRTDAPVGDRYVGRGATLLAEATIDGHSTVGTGSTVAEGARVSRSVIGAGCVIGPDAVVEGAILGDGVEVGPRCHIGHGVVAGDGARIAEGVSLDGVTVATGEHVASSPVRSN